MAINRMHKMLLIILTACALPVFSCRTNNNINSSAFSPPPARNSQEAINSVNNPAILPEVTYEKTPIEHQERLESLIAFGGYTDIWNLVSYDMLETERRQHYSNLIINEMAKYPDNFFNKINLSTIVVTKNLKFDNTHRAAVPDNYSRILFIGIRDDYTDDYLRHTFHHELNHYVEFSIWGNYRYDWDQWRPLFNGSGGGGETAYQNGENASAIGYTPNVPGFLNYYSTLGQEEDRSEIIAFFLTESRNRLFIEKALNDNLFFRKALTLFTFYKEKLGFNLLDEFLLKTGR